MKSSIQNFVDFREFDESKLKKAGKYRVWNILFEDEYDAGSNSSAETTNLFSLHLTAHAAI